jgi:transposase
MATTSFLYHAQGLQGYAHLRTEHQGGAEYHHVRLVEQNRRCRLCDARWWQLGLAGRFTRTFRALPVGSRRQYIVLHGHRQSCKACDQTAREPVSFADGNRRYTKRFGRYVVSLCTLMPVMHVAGLLGVGWDLVKDLFKEHLTGRLRRRRLGNVRYLAVDEFATHKGHKYMTVVLNLQTGEILHAHEGKGAEALVPFLKRLRRSRAQLKAIAIDMSSAYQKAVRDVFGDTVDIVFDRYHAVALVNGAIDETRREIMRSLAADEKQAVKGTRFLLLTGGEKLNDTARERLSELKDLNEPLFEAYLLKERFRRLWERGDEAEAQKFLKTWLQDARALDNPAFTRLATTFHELRKGILAWFRHRITTGPLEGLNNKIKVLKRQVYGLRDMAYFKLRLYFIHEATYSITG